MIFAYIFPNGDITIALIVVIINIIYNLRIYCYCKIVTQKVECNSVFEVFAKGMQGKGPCTVQTAQQQ